MKIAVAGMGYVGLSNAVCWRSAMRSSRWTSTRTGSTRSTPAGPRLKTLTSRSSWLGGH